MSPDEARRLLELSPLASEQGLQNAYRSMLRVWHPDRFPEGSPLHEVATARTRRLIEAFGVLTERGIAATDADAAPPCPASGRDPYGAARAPLHLSEPTPEKTRPQPARPRRPSVRVLAAVAAVFGAILVGVGLSVGGLSAAGSEGLTAPSAAMASRSVGTETDRANAADSEETVARFSMAIGSFRDLRRARSLVGDVAMRAPDVWTTIVPVEVRGAVFYRVLAGMSADIPALERGLEPLRMLLGEGSDGWMTREAGLTFCVLESGSLEDVRSTMEGARVLGIETFALRVGSSEEDGTFRVCAGSYEGPEEAAYLQRSLGEAGYVIVPRARSGDPVKAEPAAS